jgi:hypothetical protein
MQHAVLHFMMMIVGSLWMYALLLCEDDMVTAGAGEALAAASLLATSPVAISTRYTTLHKIGRRGLPT